MTRPDQFCSSCARPLKEKMIVRDGKPAKVWVCKQPICRKYMVPQR
jgi:hypothetical protein